MQFELDQEPVQQYEEFNGYLEKIQVSLVYLIYKYISSS
jgi:hypothetical protein